MDFHGYDADNHHIGDTEEEEPARKRRRVKPTNLTDSADDIDENDNSFAEDAGEGDEEAGEYSEFGEDNSESPEIEQVVNPYLQLRQKNIEDRKRKEEELGIIPHSKEKI